MSATQSTAPRTVTSKTGMILPATITPQTDLNTGIAAAATYYRMSESAGSWSSLIALVTALQDSSAVVVEYVALDGERTCRVLWPNAITLSKENHIVAKCYCTLRRTVKCFRLDRILTCHALTTPDDMEPPAAQA